MRYAAGMPGGPTLETVTLAHFGAVLHEGFALRDGETTLDLELIEAEALSARPPAARAPFALVFRGPLAPILPQRIYALQHDALGTLDIFLVPIGADRAGQRYEAIFN